MVRGDKMKVRPWRPEHMYIPLEQQTREGKGFKMGEFKGHGCRHFDSVYLFTPACGLGGVMNDHALPATKRYNEIVLKSQAWIDHLPHSVEAIFIVECTSGEANTVYPWGWSGVGHKPGEPSPKANSLAKNCSAAQASGRAWHRRFLAEFGLSADEFPLVRLDPWNWKTPFSADNLARLQ